MIDEPTMRSELTAAPLDVLLARAAALRDDVFGATISHSRKVFIPLTRLCRDVCSYCTFARPPRAGERCYLSPEEIVGVAEAGARAGCHEALFTLGDKPELRYAAARRELAELGYDTTIDYLAAMCRLVFERTGLLPHANPGVMDEREIASLRGVAVSQGIMLESSAERLCAKGGPHFGSPDKHPAVRLRTIEAAGRLAVPFTTGILIGIGETRAERLDALFALQALHQRYGHIQEIIVQNFRAKPDTRMAGANEPSRDEHLWTIAAARLIFGGTTSIQAPPNLSGDDFGALIGAGIDDWGGVSPVTPDHVNPEAPWPEIGRLGRETAARGKTLVQRLAVYPSHLADPQRWLDGRFHRPVLELTDAGGFVREEGWRAGSRLPAPAPLVLARSTDPATSAALGRAEAGQRLNETDITRLFAARGADFEAVCAAADALRARTVGDTVRYVVNRNINYTNVCTHGCGFCAFSKGRRRTGPGGAAYDLDLEEVARRVTEAWERGATEVCMQGGIHPRYTGRTYVGLVGAARRAAPGVHVHAFSPLEVRHGAASLGLPVRDYLVMLRDAGLASLPGTAAEILDDEVRAVICPDKLDTAQWLEVIEAAHEAGLPTTATIMFGHVERPVHWARHLLRLCDLQARTDGITEFVPLPFVADEAPLHRKGRTRPGPTFREAVLMHAVSRLVLHPLIPNIQVSWVKMGEEGVKAALRAGANDLGGTLMNESISRAAGADHGQEWSPERMETVIAAIGRRPEQRTTLYGEASAERIRRGREAPPLAPLETGTRP